ncbi:uncharacterized protein VICG_00631 [Vittaforma corneae ATCC 50505]|uniref:Uncharacterized protein n=1 Tax=Vittaforma corneae (strain ATCC 50505) TaxID=993615 RepID=L2GPJ9_VITCO|nr:uncharacterized protein VICG_00631 [Vittaforma corneae ATCC 50505]ELA42232.1 hypothetical protein VICG_00631 [Vittaforma corneae ATCC 50505]
MQDISKTQSMQNDASIQPEQQITTSFTLFELSITNVAIFWGLIVILAEFLPHIKIFGWNVLPTSILSKIAMSRDSVVKYSFGWIPKFIKAWDSTSTTLFPAVESKKFCNLCIKMVVEFVSSFFELVLSVINLPSGVFVTGDFSKSGNNLREAGRHFWNFICTLLMIRHLIWFLGSFLIAMIVEAFRILFVYLSIFVVILVYAVYIVIFVYMKLLGLKPKLSAIRLWTSKDSTAKVADTGSNILPSDISNSKFYKQFLENYIKKAQDPLLLPWDFVNFWGATEPEKLKLSRQVVGELRDRGLFNSGDSFMHKKLKHHARNHFIVDSRFFLILEASYSYLRGTCIFIFYHAIWN